MNFKKAGAELFVPDGKPFIEALRRTTCMSISAHHDDIEIMAYHGIAKCFGSQDEWFFGIVLTDGAGSPRSGLYQNYSDEEIKKIRAIEQKKAAYIGEYGAMALLNYSSAEIKAGNNRAVIEEIKELIILSRPKTIYTHNLADKHDTHVATALKVINSIRELPTEARPESVYGCEVWRSLDWVNDNEKLKLDVSAQPNIAAAILGVHASQISGGKRYDLATEGRRLANATYSASHSTDATSALSYAMDLTPLIQNDKLDIVQYIQEYIERFSRDVSDRLKKLL